jgi:hypothetical protein
MIDALDGYVCGACGWRDLRGCMGSGATSGRRFWDAFDAALDELEAQQPGYAGPPHR